jgi:hypothetical protein
MGGGGRGKSYAQSAGLSRAGAGFCEVAHGKSQEAVFIRFFVWLKNVQARQAQ